MIKEFEIEVHGFLDDGKSADFYEKGEVEENEVSINVVMNKFNNNVKFIEEKGFTIKSFEIKFD